MKMIKIGLAFCLLFLLTSCSPKLEENIGVSEYFSATEIQAAIDTVKLEVDNYLLVADLTELTFDEDISQQIITEYLPTIETIDYTNENTIVFYSEFQTKRSSGSLDPNTHYENYYWILTQQDNQNWQIIFNGFLN